MGREWPLRARPLLAGLAALALIAVGACASTHIAAPGPTPTAKPCVLAAANPDPTRTYAVARLDEADVEHRCNVSDRTLAVHVLGQFRNIYGPEATDKRGEPLPISAADAISRVIKMLRDEAAAKTDDSPLKILIFVHGGLVDHRNAVLAAESLAPGMIADGYTPVFLIWNSDIATSYGDRLCCVKDGEQWVDGKGFFVPVRAAGDVAASGARAVENFAQQWLRFHDSVIKKSGTPYYLRYRDTDLLCRDLVGACPHLIYPKFAEPRDADTYLNDQRVRIRSKQIEYAALWPVRVAATVTLPEVGAKAWDNMVRRTRLALENAMLSSDAYDASSKPCETMQADADRRAPSRKPQAALAPDEPRYQQLGFGGFGIFFARLDCEIAHGRFTRKADGVDRPVPLELYFYGHSMGAIVGDEAIWRYPNLPWKRIVFMAAATSIRDFRTSVVPILRCTGRDAVLAESKPCCLGVQFYGLSLHPIAESRELNLGGAPPQGSLLEWIDEMFGGPRSFDDRMLGKWTNVEETLPLFPSDARANMTFKVFPKQEDLRHGDPAEKAVFNAACTPGPGLRFGDIPANGVDLATRCHPIGHGDFTNFSFWRDAYIDPPSASP